MKFGTFFNDVIKLITGKTLLVDTGIVIVKYQLFFDHNKVFLIILMNFKDF